TSSLRPAIFDGDCPSLGPAEFAQSLHKGGRPLAPRRRRARAQKSDCPQLAHLLRPRRERPRGRAAEKRDELAPLHSITSSASSTNESGIVSPIPLAALRLTINS